MTIGKGKRPRDPNQLAKWIVEQSIADAPEPVQLSDEPKAPVSVPADLSAYMAAMGRKGGQIGGKRRLLTMTSEKRREVAAKAAKTRWDKSGSKP